MNKDSIINRLVKSKVTLIVVVATIVVVLLFFSFSYAFSTHTESRGALNIVTAQLFAQIDSPSLNDQNQITVDPGETVEFPMSLVNINSTDAKFNLFYSSSQNLDDIKVGYLLTGDDAPDESGVILRFHGHTDDHLDMKIRIANTGDQSVTITFGATAGMVGRILQFPQDRSVIPIWEEQFYLQTRNNQHAFWQDSIQEQIRVINFSGRIQIPQGVEVWDVSLNQDNTVIAFLDYNEQTGQNDILRIQANGRIMAPVSSTSLLSGFTNAIEINQIELLDTSNVTNMTSMFQNNHNLIELDLSTFDTSNVTNMVTMFQSMHSLERLDVSNFDTSNVTMMMSIFHNMTSITHLDLRSFNTLRVMVGSAFFMGTSSLEEVLVTTGAWQSNHNGAAVFSLSNINSVTFYP